MLLELAAAHAAGQLTFRGLRHTFAAELAENDITDSEIALWLEQKTTAMARHDSSRRQERGGWKRRS